MKNTTKKKLLELFSGKDDAIVLTLLEEGFLQELLGADLGNIDRKKLRVALGIEKELPAVQTYRFNIKNLDPNDELVREEMEMVFGEVEIVNWWCETPMHGEGLVAGGGMMPQRLMPVVVEYRVGERGEKMIPLQYPPIPPGTSVKTTRENPTLSEDWTEEGKLKRKWGVQGIVLTHHDSHGLYYDIRHEDGTEGCYDPSELEIVKQ